MAISLNISNIVDIEKLIKETSDSLNDKSITKSNSKSALKLQALSKQTFINKKDPFGRPWAKLKSRTGQPLRDSGRLFNSVSSQGKKDSIRVFVEGNLAYAGIHNNGYQGAQNVRAHTRTITKAFGKNISPISINIKSFVRIQDIPMRMFIPNNGIIPTNWLTLVEDEIIENLN